MADDDRNDRRRRSMAPLVVFGGMGLIGISTMAVVAIGHCQREEPYLDSVILERGEVRRGAPTPSPAPGQWGTGHAEDERERDSADRPDAGVADEPEAAPADEAEPVAPSP